MEYISTSSYQGHSKKMIFGQASAKVSGHNFHSWYITSLHVLYNLLLNWMTGPEILYHNSITKPNQPSLLCLHWNRSCSKPQHTDTFVFRSSMKHMPWHNKITSSCCHNISLGSIQLFTIKLKLKLKNVSLNFASVLLRRKINQFTGKRWLA